MKSKVQQVSSEELKQEFDKLWKLYPNKQGKVKAFESYAKARKKGATYNEVIRGLERYLAYCSREDWYRPKNGSTWFNQQSWLDEIDEGENDLEIVKDKFGNIII